MAALVRDAGAQRAARRCSFRRPSLDDARLRTLPSFAGVVVSDGYVNYYSKDWEHIAGHQACLAHILRDYQDAVETYPEAIWPVQASGRCAA